MTTINTEKIRKNADLIQAFSACPIGDPIIECPFISYYKIQDERRQVEQIEIIPQDQLDQMRIFHRSCMDKYRKGEWTTPEKQVSKS